METEGVASEDEHTTLWRQPRSDLRSCRPAARVAGITGYDRLSAGIPVRDQRGMKRSRRSITSKAATKDADLQVFYASDGTRTRDLGRDRPIQPPEHSRTNNERGSSRSAPWNQTGISVSSPGCPVRDRFVSPNTRPRGLGSRWGEPANLPGAQRSGCGELPCWSASRRASSLRERRPSLR